MIHSFNVQIAKDHGVDEAIFMHNVEFWTRTNLANRKNIHEGLCWTYNKLDAFCEILPYYNRRQIEHLINKLIKKGLLLKGNYNKTQYDRTGWYAMTPLAYDYYKDTLSEEYKHIMNATYPQQDGKSPYFPISQKCEMEFTNLRNGVHKNVNAIPDALPALKKDIKSFSASPDQKPTKSVDNSFAKRKEPPRQPDKVPSQYVTRCTVSEEFRTSKRGDPKKAADCLTSMKLKLKQKGYSTDNSPKLTPDQRSQ